MSDRILMREDKWDDDAREFLAREWLRRVRGCVAWGDVLAAIAGVFADYAGLPKDLRLGWGEAGALGATPTRRITATQMLALYAAVATTCLRSRTAYELGKRLRIAFRAVYDGVSS